MSLDKNKQQIFTKSIPSWKDKYSVVFYNIQLCVQEHLKRPEEQFVVKY